MRVYLHPYFLTTNTIWDIPFVSHNKQLGSNSSISK